MILDTRLLWREAPTPFGKMYDSCGWEKNSYTIWQGYMMVVGQLGGGGGGCLGAKNNIPGNFLRIRTKVHQRNIRQH